MYDVEAHCESYEYDSSRISPRLMRFPCAEDATMQMDVKTVRCLHALYRLPDLRQDTRRKIITRGRLWWETNVGATQRAR